MALVVFLAGIVAAAAGGRADAVPAAESAVRRDILYIGTGGTPLLRDSAGRAEPIAVFSPQIEDWTVRSLQAAAFSPDGARVAAAAVLERDGELDFRILVADVDLRRTETRWRSDEFAPFFLGWAPDSRQIAFLAGEQGSGFRLIIADGSNPEGVLVARGAPLYFDWLADGEQILVHTNGALALHSAATGEQRSLVRARPGRFRAPDTRPGTDEVTAVIARPEGQSIALIGALGQVETQATVTTGGAFAWDPDGRYLAVLNYRLGGRVGGISIVDSQASQRVVRAQTDGVTVVPVRFDAPQVPTQLAERVSFAIQWLPKGTGLIALSVGEDERRLVWELFRRSDERWVAESIASVRPTPAYLQQILPFFDQYARVGVQGAPDGSAFVYDSLEPGSGAAIFVYDFATGSAQRLGNGVLPSWRPDPTVSLP